jgi:RHS repeat-associated protein
MDSAKAPAINESLLGATYVYKSTRGNKLYELTNHLGNVLTTISDRKIGHGTGTEYDYYTPDIISATDYYPFGSEMPNRTYSVPSYRYGFNGKENDNDVKGEGNQIDYGMRIYDPRLGLWLSKDALQSKHPYMSPYNFCYSNPLILLDPDGKDVIIQDQKGNKVAVVKADGKIIAEKGKENSWEVHSYQEAQAYLAGKGNLTFLEKNSRATIIRITTEINENGSGFTAGHTVLTGKDLNKDGKLEMAEVTGAHVTSSEIGIIVWNPNTAATDAEGNSHTSALLLEHEVNHAKHALTNMLQQVKDGETKFSDGTDNNEERKTIAETNTTSINLNNGDGGYGKRIKHRGDLYQSASPTSVISQAQYNEFMQKTREKAWQDILKKIPRDNLGGQGDGADGLLRGGGKSNVNH